jgi:hypothetical protein
MFLTSECKIELSNDFIFQQAWASDGLYKTNLERSDDEQYEVWEDSPDPRHVIIQMNLCFRYTYYDI